MQSLWKLVAPNKDAAEKGKGDGESGEAKKEGKEEAVKEVNVGAGEGEDVARRQVSDALFSISTDEFSTAHAGVPQPAWVDVLYSAVSSFHSVTAVQLSVWDNILGPTGVRLWACRDISTSCGVDEDELYGAVAQHTLSGEIFRPNVGQELDLQFQLFPSLRSMLCVCVFEARARNTLQARASKRPSTTANVRSRSTLKYSLALVLPLDRRPLFLASHQVVEDRLMMLAMALQAMLGEDAMDTPDVAAAAMDVFKQYIQSTVEEIDYFLTPPSVGKSVSMTLAMCTTLPPPLDAEGLARALTAHFAAKFHTVVIGIDKGVINLLVDFLSFFCPFSSLHRCRRVEDSEGVSSYRPDLMVQGISISSVQGQTDWLKSEDMLTSLDGTAVVEVQQDRVLVLQGLTPLHFAKERKEFIEFKVHQMCERAFGADGSESFEPSGSLIEPMRDVASPALCMVETLLKMPVSPSLREDFLLHWKMNMWRKAYALVTFVEGELAAGHTLQVVGPTGSGGDGENGDGGSGGGRIEASMMEDTSSLYIDRDAQRRLRSALNLREDAANRMVLSLADLIRPGVYSTVMGDQAVIGARVVELLQTL
mmetsp:Transcript_43357/g.112790  ORF Transcript_43357/g.112790 Transcript_43357/m.112790 type:complete len:593 (-) Transcript_43357:1239-3017(-)